MKHPLAILAVLLLVPADTSAQEPPGVAAAGGVAASVPARVETLMVPMRDGVRLATDVYRVPGAERAPVALLRTPYDKSKQQATAERFVKAGYTTVIQDCRGAFASEGVLIPYDAEGPDGYDCLEWLTKQPWCDGRVGMWGSSYTGATQWQAAVEHPPGLVAITPRATWTSFQRNLYLGGAVRLALIAKWAAGNSRRPDAAKPPADWDDVLDTLPLAAVDDAIGWPIPWLESFLTHPEPGGFWNRLNLTPRIVDLDLPIQHLVGVYDFFSRESVDNFRIMRTQARDPAVRARQQLILGPWDHGTIGMSRVGDVDFGPAAALDPVAANIDWFDRFLKQDPAAAARPFPAVRYFSMGDNAWHEADSWPPAGVVPRAFHLRSDGHANSSRGTGTLTAEPPAADEPADSFRADPADPVPACPVTEQRPLHAATWGPVDQTALEARDDVLVYTGAPLAAPLRFAGSVEARLHVSADTPDADWVVKLVDVRPDGFAQNLAVGILRGRYRDSLDRPRLLEPGKVYEIAVDLGPVAATILPGHRLRVDVCGAYFPLFDRNPNTAAGPAGAATAVATERVLHAAATPSRIILPCLAP